MTEQCGTEFEDPFHPKTAFSPTHIHIPAHIIMYIHTLMHGTHTCTHIDGLSEGGAVVDLTNDSGVEDEDVVDLTSPIQVSLTLELVSIMTS